MPSPQFRIYYGDGSTVDSNAGAVESVPKTDVIYINDWQPDGRMQDWHGTDFYVWEWGQWFGRDWSGLYQYLFRPGFKLVLFGYHILDAPHQRGAYPVSSMLRFDA